MAAKGLTADDLRSQPEDELVPKLKEAKEELFNLRFQAATGQLETTVGCAKCRRRSPVSTP